MKARIMGKVVEVADDRLGRKATPPARKPTTMYRSKLEQRFAQELERRRAVGQIEWVRYEAVEFRLSQTVRYRPDFIVCQNNALTVYEVKGWARNRRDGITRLKWLAKDWPMLLCILVEYRRGVWDYTVIT